MVMYWHFELGAVAERSLYLESLESTESIFEVQAHIEAFRQSVAIRPRSAIPC
jgi:hypothetical protein